MTIIQVNPCVETEDGISRCETPKANFFGVYLSEHDVAIIGYAGRYDWLADFAQASEALEYVNKLCVQYGHQLEDNT